MGERLAASGTPLELIAIIRDFANWRGTQTAGGRKVENFATRSILRVKIVSPVDGSVVAERPSATAGEIEAALAAANRAQQQWHATSLVERAQVCSAAVEAMLAMADEIAPELAWQMGRPVQYGGRVPVCPAGLRPLADRDRPPAASSITCRRRLAASADSSDASRSERSLSSRLGTIRTCPRSTRSGPP